MIKFRYLLLFFVSTSLSADELYNLDFTPPEVGTYQIIFGSPSVQASAGSLTDALIFDAVTSYEQIRLPIEVVSPQYELHFDLLTHNLLNSQYAFSINLDTPEVRNLDFHGGLNTIRIFQPGAGEFTLSPLANDQVYHLDISVDLPANLWTVSIDGAQKFSNPIGASGLGSIRFTMSPWIFGATDAPGTYAALDNVVVNAVPEPSTLVLTMLAVAFVFLRRQTLFASRH